MAMRGTKNVRPSGMDGGVDCESRCVEEAHRTGFGKDGAVVRDEKEGGGLDEGEVQAEWVDPEAIGANWVLR